MNQKRKNRKRRHSGTAIVLFVLALAICLGAVLLVDSFKVSCYSQLKWEAGQPLPQAADFFPKSEVSAAKKAVLLTDFNTIATDVPGSYPVQLQVGDKVLSSRLDIVDTVAPTPREDAVIINPKSADPMTFVTDLKDATKVTAKFETVPDITKAGKQKVCVILTDAAGNTTKLPVTVIVDTAAPVIQGVKDLEIYLGESVAYRLGIVVTDDQDETPQLEIDTSKVDLSKAGVYTVTYRATDHAGNTKTLTAKLTVRPKGANHVEPEVIYKAVDDILAKFIREDMTDRQKVEAVYVWTRRGVHLTYGPAPDRDDWLQTAYEFLQTKKGDCFYFYAIQKLMLQRLGIPTIDVVKVKNHAKDSNHYWLLVSIDGGKSYYHMDNVWSKSLCLVTDEKLNNFSKVQNNCFNRDESLYPATPTQSLPANTLPWDDQAILNARP